MHRTCEYYQTRLLAYIGNDLPHQEISSVAHHIRHCDACYAAYIRQQETTRQLKHDLMLVGTTHPEQLKRIWEGVQGGLARPRPRIHKHFDWQRGLVGAAFAILCMLPWGLALGDVMTPTTQTIPPVAMPQTTPDHTMTHTSPGNRHTVALHLATENAQPPTPTSTPAMAPVPDKNR